MGGCGYKVTSKDSNPAEHYYDIPQGCRVAQGAGMMAYVTGLLVLIALWEFRPSASDTDARGKYELLQ